jgi:hypothetical protein
VTDDKQTRDAMTDSPDTRPVPSMKALEAAAIKRLTEMLKNDPGKIPSEEAMLMAAKLMAAKAHRELTAQQKGNDGKETVGVSRTGSG